MVRAIFQIILLCFTLVGVSIFYLLCLWLSLPVWVILILVWACGVGWYMWIVKGQVHDLARPGRVDLSAVLILVTALAVIVFIAYGVEEQYGLFDAWWFWNLRGKYLSKSEFWQLAFSGNQYGTLFTAPVVHSDYPPFLPLLNGLCWRVAGAWAPVVPFAWGMLSLLLIPAALFLDIYARSRIIGFLTLLFFCDSKQYDLAWGWPVG